MVLKLCKTYLKNDAKMMEKCPEHDPKMVETCPKHNHKIMELRNARSNT